MLLVGLFALFEAWRVLHGQRAVYALVLGLAAVALAAWHLTRKEASRR